jgi:probable addiction module antidote protein
MKKNKYRTLAEITEEYLRDHPEEIDDYIAVLFDEYADSGDATTLFASLRLVGRIKGVTAMAEAAGLSRKGLQKALSENGNPQFGSVNTIMNAMGYRLAPQKLSETPSLS